MSRVSVVFCVLFMVLQSGCSRNMRMPGTPIIPFLDSAALGKAEMVLHSNGFDLKSTIKIKGPASFSFIINNGSGHTYTEGALGYSTQAPVRVGMLAGYGYGTTDFQEGSGGSSYDLYGHGKYKMFFLQPMISGGDKYSTTGLLFKLGWLHYAIKDLNHYYNIPELEFYKYYSGTSLEAGFFHQHYYDSGFILSLYLGINKFDSSIPLNTSELEDGGLLGIGFGFRF